MIAPPVLLVGFNRPDNLRKVSRVLKEAGIEKVYLSTDGPRPGCPKDVSSIEAGRRFARSELGDALFLERAEDCNRGLRSHMISAIDWFFSMTDAGVILEDDCVPEPVFFELAHCLLQDYASENRVAQVSGHNPFPLDAGVEHGFMMSRNCHIWGWATWASRWHSYEEFRLRLSFSEAIELARKVSVEYGFAFSSVHKVFLSICENSGSSWAAQWGMYNRAIGAGNLVPTQSLVSNIGFGIGATHTLRRPHWFQVTSTVSGDNIKPEIVQGGKQFDSQFELLLLAYRGKLFRFLTRLFFWATLRNVRLLQVLHRISKTI